MLDTAIPGLAATPLADLRRMVELGATMQEEARTASERDRDYYDGHQLTAEERATLAERRQPPIVINRIRRKIDAMVGIEQRGRVDPRAFPREPGDEDAAELATKALLFVESRERLDIHRSAAFENLLVEGYGGVEVAAGLRAGQLDVVVNKVRWEEIVFDPHSREKDFSDASYVGVVKWMSLDAARAFAANFAGDGLDLDAALDMTTPTGTMGDSYDDRPSRWQAYPWADKAQRRVRVAQLYHLRDGVWHLSVLTGRAVLYSAVSPYLDGDGKPACAILLMSAYVDRENRRYGLVRDMISPQDEINKRRSKILHSLNSRQTVGVKGAVDSVSGMKRELADPAGHVELNADAIEDAARVGMKPFDILPTGDQNNVQAMLLQEAKGEIDMLGPNPALVGQGASSASGRAIMAQQQAGLAELAPIYDSLRDWTERVYRAVWARIRQTWDGPRWVRITEQDAAPQFLGINQPAVDPATGLPMVDPYTGQPVLMNQVGAIDVDIIVDQAPEYATLRAEQFETLAGLAQAGVPIPPQLIVEASDLRDKRKLLAMLEPPPEPQAPAGPPPVDPVVQQLALRDAVAEVAGKEARAVRDRAAATKDVAQAERMQADADKDRTLAAIAQAQAVRVAQLQALRGY